MGTTMGSAANDDGRHLPAKVEGQLRRLFLAGSACALIGGAAGGLGSSAAGAAGGDRDCADFGTQAAAQAFFESSGPGDPHALDGDGDGIACESNPCPCSGAGGDDPVPPPSPVVGSGGARVTEVTDGDTIAVQIRGRAEDIRIIGIDTPEVYFGAECGGADASVSMNQMLAPGYRVRLIRDRSQENRDRYGRLLRYVEHAGRDVGRRQVRRGWAKAYVYETAFDRLRSYRRAEKRARRRGRGVWSRCGGDFHQSLTEVTDGAR
jgi:endonuclease YncB( thermonuclease family)